MLIPSRSTRLAAYHAPVAQPYADSITRAKVFITPNPISGSLKMERQRLVAEQRSQALRVGTMSARCQHAIGFQCYRDFRLPKRLRGQQINIGSLKLKTEHQRLADIAARTQPIQSTTRQPPRSFYLFSGCPRTQQKAA